MSNEPHEEPNFVPNDNNAQRIEESIVWENFLRSAPNSPRDSKKKVYCVFHGRTVGIFETWAVTHAQCTGFPGARYKGYSTIAAANAAWEYALSTGAVGPLRFQPGEDTTTPNTTPYPTPNTTPYPTPNTTPYPTPGQSTSHPEDSTPVSPGGPFVSYYVVIRGDHPGVYQTNDTAIRAMGEDPRAHRVQVATMQEGAIVFTEQYMAGKVVTLGNA